MNSTNIRSEVSPQIYARIGGVLYLLIIGLGIFYEMIVRDSIVIPGDAMATMASLKENEFFWRLGIIAEFLSSIIVFGLILIMYKLTKPVNKDLAMLAAFFNLSAATIQTVYIIQLVEVLFPIGAPAYLQAFTTEQLGAMVSLSMKSHVFGFGIALLMFGPYFLITGFLIYKSNYLPKFIGILYILSGVGYLVNSVMLILAPQFSGIVFMIVMPPVFIGEMSLALTMLIKGVNETEWNKYASNES
ncbi:MAG TPA: DUF4386 domain-containing protein [Cyclobacteriaceae bacterium]|jgi:hypothetical protein